MSRYISKLPPEIRELAEKRRSEQRGESKQDALNFAFDWDKTEEGIIFWDDIYHNIYSAFYTIYYPQKDKLDELIEWVNMEYPNFNLEDFNNKAKEIKGK